MAYPSPPPKNLVLNRSTENDGAAIEAKWGNPADGATEESDHKWGGIDSTWVFHASRDMDLTVQQNRGNGHVMADVIWVRDKGIHESETMYYDRSKYHPVNWGRFLYGVTADIYAFGGGTDTKEFYNGLGTARGLAHAKMTYDFQLPRLPEIAEPTLDAATGIVSFAITADEGKDEHERYDTEYHLVRQDSANRGNQYASGKVIVNWTQFRETSKTVTWDTDDAQSIGIGQWVKITCFAKSRGLKGDTEMVRRDYYHSYPAMATIRSIVASSLDGSGVVTVRLATNATVQFPVDTVKLQRLANTTIGTSASASTAQGWADVSGAVDNGACTGLSDQVVDAIPDARKHTWYRLVTTHGALVRYSAPVEAECLYREKDAIGSSVLAFTEVRGGDDAQSIHVQMAWPQDDCNACEIAWSEFEDAWESNQQPTSFVVDWTDEVPATGHHRSATVSLRGLEDGKAYYIRARRILQANGSTTNAGQWCTPAKAYYPVTPASHPTDVELKAPSVVERGRGIDCTWTYNGTEQTAWQVCHTMSDGTRKELAHGTGPAGACTVPAVSAEKTVVGSYSLTEDESVAYGKAYYTRSGSGTAEDPDVFTQVAEPDGSDIATYYEFSTEEVDVDELLLTVSITTGGDWTESLPVSVKIADAPIVSVSAPSTLTAQPLVLSLESSVPNAEVTLYVASRGVYSSSPSGYVEQARGDIVWSEVVKPSWELSGGTYTASVTAPKMELFDGATYVVSMSAKDTATGLKSQAPDASFDVSWAHQASIPGKGSEVNVDDLLRAAVTAEAPEGAAETDVFDVYRHTADGDYLIASDVPFGVYINDDYAPFSRDGEGLAYRICTRTADGDVEWTDVPYELRSSCLRFDWDGKSLELPYDVAFSSSWDKGFEARERMDGARAGVWRPGTARSATLSTDLVKVELPEHRRLLAELAAYAGPVFVRTHDGAAFQANVTVESYGVSYDSAKVPVSFNATEVMLTDEFKPAADNWFDQSEEEPDA